MTMNSYMPLYFSHFKYDTQQQLLFKNNNPQPLKRNQALMLEVFLSDVDKVHSKDDLLDAVWGPQVVSEQVVFQTISQLRSLLGSEAIQTFSKKGYKWSLDVSTEPMPTHCQQQRVITGVNKGAFSRLIIPTLLFCSLLFVSAMAFLLIRQTSEQSSIYVLSSDTTVKNTEAMSASELLKQALMASAHFEKVEFRTDASSEQAFFAPRQVLKAAKINTSDWLSWGALYSAPQSYVLHYGLASHVSQWQGYIQASNLPELQAKLTARLVQLNSMGVISKKGLANDINRLRDLLQAYPEDLDLILLAAKYHEKINQDDVALGYLKRLIRVANKTQAYSYAAIAHWRIGRLYKMRGQHTQSRQSLTAMAKVLTDLPVSPLHFNYIKTKAWLAFSETKTDEMFNALQAGTLYFENLADKKPLLTFKMHILTSILSEKVGDHEQKYHHLNLANALLLEHGLDTSNQAIVFYHSALFAKYRDQQSEYYATYLQKILTLPRTIDNFWVLDEALELLVRHFIKKQNYQAAHALFENLAITPRRQLLTAEVLLAQEMTQAATALLEQSFEQALIEYDNRTAIEAALWLYKLSKNDSKSQSEYLAYLQANTKPEWQRKHLFLAKNHLVK